MELSFAIITWTLYYKVLDDVWFMDIRVERVEEKEKHVNFFVIVALYGYLWD